MYQNIRTVGGEISKPDATVCLIVGEETTLHAEDKALDKRLGGVLSAARKRAECTGDVGEVTPVYTNERRRYLLVGLGKAGEIDPKTLRAAAAGLIKALDAMGVARVHVSVGYGVAALGHAEAFGRAFGDGLGLAAFTFDDFKAATKKKTKVTKLAISTTNAVVTQAMSSALILAESVNFARRLAALPPNVATTTYIAAEARKLARTHTRLTCKVIDGKSLETNRLVGLINVGKASKHRPCLIELTYTPKGRSKGCVLLVGKTICYDTGGLSVKINNTMKGMKYDKCGGMTVLGTMRAIAQTEPQCTVVALLPTAENSISENAQRPDDILTYPNGVTVEVANTDAEGRLVLADALVYGCKKIKPDAVIDVATLTGGVVVALGKECAGFWCEDENLQKKLEAAAEATGERIWRLPLFNEYKEMMKSQHADIWNSATVRDAHPIQGAAFLSYFVDAKIPWAHVDIAGVADLEKECPPFVAGPTGFGVRLLSQLLECWGR